MNVGVHRLHGVSENTGVDRAAEVGECHRADNIPAHSVGRNRTGEGIPRAFELIPTVGSTKIAGPAVGIAISVAHCVILKIGSTADTAEQRGEPRRAAIPERLPNRGIGRAAQDDPRPPVIRRSHSIRPRSCWGDSRQAPNECAIPSHPATHHVHAVAEDRNCMILDCSTGRIVMHFKRLPRPLAEIPLSRGNGNGR